MKPGAFVSIKRACRRLLCPAGGRAGKGGKSTKGAKEEKKSAAEDDEVESLDDIASISDTKARYNRVLEVRRIL